MFVRRQFWFGSCGLPSNETTSEVKPKIQEILSASSMMTYEYLVIVSLLCVAVSTLSVPNSSFNDWDQDDNGGISFTEILLRYVLEHGGSSALHDIESSFQNADADDDGYINIDEFNSL
ncbi:hypothetical protein RRG08_042425 [Elysia crispata]|uniref:EF-hand domain-containing protein n=1 Tax=Elysia crispata TaxID=231223 RepID=A0AAE0ZDC6_9GAST|nr:hypothetical protein RRG08_042425 [Elysia crispata]